MTTLTIESILKVIENHGNDGISAKEIHRSLGLPGKKATTVNSILYKLANNDRYWKQDSSKNKWYSLRYKEKEREQREEKAQEEQKEKNARAALLETIECPICCETMIGDRPPVGLGCGHTLCKQCIDIVFPPPARRAKCPTCRRDCTMSNAHVNYKAAEMIALVMNQ